METFTPLLKMVDEKMNELRGMLTVSDGRCVEKYLKEGKAMSSSMDDLNTDGLNHFYVVEGKPLDAIVEESIRKCLAEIEFPQIRCISMKTITFRCLKLKDYHGLSQPLAQDNVAQPSNCGYLNSTVIFNLRITLEFLYPDENEWRKIFFHFNASPVDTVHRYKNYILFWRNQGFSSVEDIETAATVGYFVNVLKGSRLDFLSGPQTFHLLYVPENGDQMIFSTKNWVNEKFCQIPKILKK